MNSRTLGTVAIAAILTLGGCADGGDRNAQAGSGDPYGATGAPGADMTDGGADDGADGAADANTN